MGTVPIRSPVRTYVDSRRVEKVDIGRALLRLPRKALDSAPWHGYSRLVIACLKSGDKLQTEEHICDQAIIV